MFDIMIDVEVPCPFCGKTSVVSVPLAGFLMWQSGTSIQEAMPDVDATTRECLISGICPDCQESIFGEDDPEDDDFDDDCEEGFDPYLGCFTFDC